MKTRTDPRLTSLCPVDAGMLHPIIFGCVCRRSSLTIVLLARANVFTFPLPNEDDDSFFFPHGASLFTAHFAFLC